MGATDRLFDNLFPFKFQVRQCFSTAKNEQEQACSGRFLSWALWRAPEFPPVSQLSPYTQLGTQICRLNCSTVSLPSLLPCQWLAFSQPPFPCSHHLQSCRQISQLLFNFNNKSNKDKNNKTHLIMSLLSLKSCSLRTKSKLPRSVHSALLDPLQGTYLFSLISCQSSAPTHPALQPS